MSLIPIRLGLCLSLSLGHPPELEAKGAVSCFLSYSGGSLAYFPSGTDTLGSRCKSTSSQMPEDYSWEGQQTNRQMLFPHCPDGKVQGQRREDIFPRPHGVRGQVEPVSHLLTSLALGPRRRRPLPLRASRGARASPGALITSSPAPRSARSRPWERAHTQGRGSAV